MEKEAEASFAKKFASLIEDGRSLYQPNISITDLPAGLEDRIQGWIERALNLAREVRADSVSITGGFPAGLSVTVNLKLE